MKIACPVCGQHLMFEDDDDALLSSMDFQCPSCGNSISIVIGLTKNVKQQAKKCESPKSKTPRFFILDGTNIYRGGKNTKYGIKWVLRIIEELQHRSLSFFCFFDANTRYHLFKSEDLPVYKELLKDGEHFAEVTGGDEADEPLLIMSRTTPNSVVVSNDQFRDYGNDFKRMKKEGRIVRFTMTNESIILHSPLGWNLRLDSPSNT